MNNPPFSRLRWPVLLGLLTLMELLLGLQPALALSYNWNGSVSQSWTTAANWSPNGVPGTVDQVAIGAASQYPRLESPVNVAGFTLSGGNLDLNGFHLTISGNVLLNSGTVSGAGHLVCRGASTSLGATGTLLLTADLDVNSATVLIQNTILSGTGLLTKTGSSLDHSGGNNVFQGTLTLTNAGTGAFRMGKAGQKDIFNGELSLSNTGTGLLHVGYAGTGHEFNADIVLSCTNGQGIQLGNGNGYASSLLAIGKKVRVGTGGFTTGTLSLTSFSQAADPLAPAVDQQLTLSGTARMNLSYALFRGSVIFQAPVLSLGFSTFQSTARLVNFGSTNCTGGNVFQGKTTLVNSGFWNWAYNLGDTFNGDLVLINQSSSSGRFTLVYSGGGSPSKTVVNGNVEINITSSSSAAIELAWVGGSGETRLAAGKTLKVGTDGGFPVGVLTLRGLTVEETALPLTLSVPRLSLDRCHFKGPVAISAGMLSFQNCQFLAQTSLTRQTSVTEYCAGGNHFSGKATLTNAGGGDWFLAQTASDSFGGETTLINSGSGGFFPANAAPGTRFDGALTLQCTNGKGIRLGVNGGTSLLKENQPLLIGTFSAGELALFGFTQAGTRSLSGRLSGWAGLRLGTGTRLGGSVDFTAPHLYLDGATFEGAALFTKTGSGTNSCRGGNTFTRQVRILNQAPANSQLQMATSVDDVIIE